MRRPLTAVLVALLVAAMFPFTAMAAVPVANGASPTTNEDAPYEATLLASDDDGDPVTEFTISSGPAHGSLGALGAIECNGGTPAICTTTVTYTPDEDWNGADGFSYTATAGGETSDAAAFDVTVHPVNDPPSFTAGGDQSVAEDAGLQTVNGFIAVAAPGPATATDETGQTLTYTLLADNTSLFATQPAIDAGGTLTYTPAANLSGTATVSVSATDDGTPLPAQSGAQSFDIAITSENDAPTFSITGDKTVDEDAGAQSFGGFITASSPGPGAADEAGQTIAYTVEADDTALFSAQPEVAANGELSFTPAADASGETSVSIFATDSAGGVSGTQEFTITVTLVNDPPSFTPGAGVQVAKGQGAYDQPWATDIEAGPGESDGVTFTALAADQALFTDQPAIGPTGRLTFTPGTAAGSTLVTVTVTDDGTPAASSAPVSFVITITDGPAALAQAVSLDEDSGANTITLTGFDPEDDELDFALASSPTHGSLTGTVPDLTYTPAPNYFGADSFTFTVSDGVTVSPAATVAITVANVNDVVDARTDVVTVVPTTTTVFNVLAANGGSPDSAGAGESAGDLVITAVTAPGRGTATIAANGTSITYDPTGCTYGSDLFSYTISDGEYTDTASVVVTILRPGQGALTSKNPVTDTPAVSFITNATASSTVPMKVSWCGVTASGSSVNRYTVGQSANAGSSYAALSLSPATVTSKTRSLAYGPSYKWRAQTRDSAGRTGSYKGSLVARLARYQDSSTAISYAGAWSSSKTSNASGGTWATTSTAGATASITLTNVRAFAIVGTKGTDRGSFRVRVDGVLVATVSAKASTAYRRVLYTRTLTSGVGVSHVIVIEAVGNGRVNLDAILSLATP